MNEGKSLAGQRRFAEASDFLKFAAEKDPNDPRALYLLAYCQGNLSESLTAGESLKAACQLERKGNQFGWSKWMEQIQGPVRIWMEEERKKQLSVRDSGI